MTSNPIIGLSANEGGPHTSELLQAYHDACNWLKYSPSRLWFDDRRDPDGARAAAAHFANCGVSIVIGHLSAHASVAAVRAYISFNTTFVAPATSHPKLNPTGWDGILRAFGTDNRTAETMSLAGTPGEKPFIIEQRQSYGLALGRALSDRLIAMGTKACHVSVAYEENTPCIVSYIPDDISTLYICGIHEFCIDIIRSVRDSGFKGRIVVGDDCFTPNFLAKGVGAVENCLVATTIFPDSSRSREGDLVQGVNIEGYYPTCLIASAVSLQAVQQFPALRGAELGRAIKAHRWPTPAGLVAFDTHGDLVGLRDVLFRVEDSCMVPQVIGDPPDVGAVFRSELIDGCQAIPGPTIRPLVSTDQEHWLVLWRDYLDFYEAPEVGAHAKSTFALLCGADKSAFGLIAEIEGRPVGFAHVVIHLSTWSPLPRACMQDLFVSSEVRGQGIGQALIDAVQKTIVRAGAGELYWLTQTGNETARRLYDRVGILTEFVKYEKTPAAYAGADP